MYIIGRCFITTLPVIYIYLIWLQTSHFDPESVSSLSTVLNPYVILAIGAALELGHLFEFGILYLLLIIAWLSYEPLTKWKEILVLIFSLSYGLLDEIHQLYVPFRSYSILDLIKNAIGVLAIWYFIHQKYYATKKSRVGSLLRKITTFFNKERPNVNIKL